MGCNTMPMVCCPQTAASLFTCLQLCRRSSVYKLYIVAAKQSEAVALLCGTHVSLPQVLLTATPFRGDRAELHMVVVTGQQDDLKISQRIRQGLCSNVAYAPVPVESVQVAEAVSAAHRERTTILAACHFDLAELA